jgi:hypothetical protein
VSARTKKESKPVARIERSEIRESLRISTPAPDVASLHPGYY